jgi:hypothetical protein
LFEYFLKHSFDFKKGVFELHFFDESTSQEAKLLEEFSKSLKKGGYRLFFYGTDPNVEIDFDKELVKIKNKEGLKTLMLYFDKNSKRVQKLR